VARRLKSDLRPYDVVGRYGGEEFIIILPGCELATGARRADEIRNLVANGPFSTPFGTIPATVSVGVTVTSLGREHLVSDILHEADVSMYTAKQKRRNRAANCFPPQPDRRVRVRASHSTKTTTSSSSVCDRIKHRSVAEMDRASGLGFEDPRLEKAEAEAKLPLT
jgi:predicted signal transduction protein with EAL and GGDEF domain